MTELERHDYDVVVIGAGGAGLRAAIEAHEQGARTAVVCKSLLGKAHTVMAEGGVIAEGPPGAIGANPAVVDAYLGSSHAALTEEIRSVSDGGSEAAGEPESSAGSADQAKLGGDDE